MIEPSDPIEAELAALRPLEVSPELYRSVARGLAARSPGRSLRLWKPALAAGLAAGLAGVLLRGGGGGAVNPGPISIPAQPTGPPIVFDDSRPMLLAYQRALARSPEALGDLLDKHALTAPGPEPGLGQIRGTTRSVAVFDTFLGDN